MVNDNYFLVENEFKYWEFIRNLRNDPEIKNGFVENIEINFDQQIKYMEKYNNNYYICIDKNKKPIGYVGEINNDIRVAVIKEMHKKGVGKFMINEFMKLRPNSYAKMKFDNIASKKLFESCGFTYINSDNQFFYYKKL